MLGYRIHDALNPLGVINRNVRIHVGQGAGGGVTVAFNTQNGEAGLPCALAQVVQGIGWCVPRCQQQASERGAISRGHCTCDNNVIAIPWGHNQSSRAKVVDHIGQCAGAKSNARHASLINVPLTDNVRFQCAGNIKRAWAEQVSLPWNDAEHRAVINTNLLAFFGATACRRHVRRRLLRGGQSAMNIRCTGFVDNTAHHAGFFTAKETDL